MDDKRRETIAKGLMVVLGLVVVVLVIVLPIMYKASTIGHSSDKIREKMEAALYEKYGEEFVVDRIGSRTANGKEFYQARIYPKSIIGTPKEGDKYYYASASVNKESFGKLGGVGDSYPLVNLKLGIEDYLMPKAKGLFGERVLMNIEAHYKRREPGNVTFWGYKVNSFKEARKLIAEDPENRMIELELYLYVFDRIEDEVEKEQRRKEIFDFVQYLKEEGLFEYLELGVIFIDERVLAPSYKEFDREIFFSDKVEEVVEGETVYLPPLELRKEMSEKLQKEVDKMSEEELLASMKKIRKSDLSYKGIRKENSQYQERIYSVGMLEVNYGSSYRKYKKNNKLEHYYYKDISDIELVNNLEYVYIN
jgi:hypothetical protein